MGLAKPFLLHGVRLNYLSGKLGLKFIKRIKKGRITTMQIIQAESEFCHPGIGFLINNYCIRIANFKLHLAKVVNSQCHGLSRRQKSSACKQEITGTIRNQMKKLLVPVWIGYKMRFKGELIGVCGKTPTNAFCNACFAD